VAQTEFCVEDGVASWSVRPNRSITPRGRRLCLGFVAFNALVVAASAALLGAWPVVPFAGLEVVLVALAFRVVESHDADFERFVTDGVTFEWTRQCGHLVEALRGNLAWVRVASAGLSGSKGIRLSYSGQSVLVGRDLAERDVRAWISRRPTALGNHSLGSVAGSEDRAAALGHDERCPKFN
jgi:uncharacterized membrane protein